MTVLFKYKKNPDITIARGTSSRLGDDVYMAYRKGHRGRITPMLSSVGDVLRYVSDTEKQLRLRRKPRLKRKSR